MGLSQALWTGLSSLQAHQTWTDVIGQNLSQVNTTGYKYSNASFSDVLYNTIAANQNENGGRGSINSKQVGLGTQIGSIDQVFTSGNLEITDRTFDCAVDGGGMFVLSETNSTERYLSRNGSFYLSEPLSGNIQNLQSADGLIVQGYQVVNGVISDSISGITLPSLGTTLPGTPTSELDFSGNLDSTYPVVNGNSISTSAPGTTSGSWISDTAATLNVGAVESSASLFDSSSGTVASGLTDLLDLDFLRSGSNQQSIFNDVPSGYTVNSREIQVDFTKGNTKYSETFVYGTDGTTLDDFATWLAGDIGDNGTPSTQRLDGGVMGTVRTREYTVDGDGYAAPAEQAGAYYSFDTSGNFLLNIASNLGSFNTLADISLTTTTSVTDTSGNTHNNILSFGDFFSANAHYPEDNKGGSAIASSEIYLPNPEGEGTVEEKERFNFTLVSRDSNGSTWRWYADGDYTSVDDETLNKGTGVIRFGTTSKVGEEQVKASTVDGGTDYTFDFSKMTQLALDSSVNVDQDGYEDGELQSYTIDQYGMIDGYYTNGYTDNLAKLALAQVENSNGLEQIGYTLWKPSVISGDPIFNSIDNMSMFGSIRSNHLESSNVNMANEMTKLLLSQRGYQLGSKIVTTADDMLKEVANLKS